MKHTGEQPETCLELCIRLGKLLYKWYDRRLQELGLTPVQLQVLAALAGSKGSPGGRTPKGLTMSELSAQLCCVGSNVTAVVGRMVEAGWVERTPALEDRRARLVRLAAKGRDLLTAATQTPRCCPEAAGWLTSAEWGRLGRLLGRLAARLETQQTGGMCGADRPASPGECFIY